MQQAYAIDGDRKASLWGKTWADKTSGVFQDWLRVDFGVSRTIDEINVFSGQSNASIEPTTTLTSTYAIKDFQVQYWTGSQWSVVPGGSVTGNQLVWRRFAFAALSTTAIRVLVTGGPAMTRISELEAYQPSDARRHRHRRHRPVLESTSPWPPTAASVTASSTYSATYATNVRERWKS